MPKLFFFLTTALLFCTCIVAQNSLGARVLNAKFKMVKSTVEFLATDAETFGNKTTTTCPTCNDYKAVKQYATNNKLMKVDALVDACEKMPVDTTADDWQASLTNLKEQLIAKVASGEKEKRQKLKTYPAYTETLNEIINEVNDRKATPETDDNTTTAAKPVKATATKDSSALLPNAGTPATENFITTTLPWLSSGIAALLFVLLLLSFSKTRKVADRKEYYKQKFTSLDHELQIKNQTLSKLKSQHEALQKKLADAELDIKALEDFKRSESKPKAEAKPATEQQTSVPLMVEKPKIKPVIQQQPKPPAPLIKYANYADLGDGFSNTELLEKPDNETIFELTILPGNTGQFKIISDPNAQKFALSNAQYFLGKACQYDSFATDKSSIITDRPGTIKLNGNKWVITQQAAISFA